MSPYQLEPIEDKDMNRRSKVARHPSERMGSVATETLGGGNNETHPEAIEKDPDDEGETEETAAARKKTLEEIGEISPEAAKKARVGSKISDPITEEAKIQRLVDLAEEKGPEHAFRVAERLRNLYVLDMFHDELIKNLRVRLIEKGLLKEDK